MTRQLIFILTLLTLVACQNNRTENRLTKLEEYLIETDSLTSSSKTFDQIVIFIQTNKPSYLKETSIIPTIETPSLLREIEFDYDYDTTGKYKDRVLFSLRVKEFNSDRQAAEAFKKVIEFQSCCIADEDIVKLKNFENLEHFKNSATTTILSENILIEFIPANQTSINKEITELIDEYFKERKYLKLEIGHGGPAIWTRK